MSFCMWDQSVVNLYSVNMSDLVISVWEQSVLKQ